MKLKHSFDIQDLQRELESIANAVGTQKTKADYHKWLVRLYKAASMISLVQQEYDLHHSHNAEEKAMLAEIPGSLDMLNIYAQQALSQLRDIWRKENA